MKVVNEFKALADETRLRIMVLLLEESLCVCEIMDILKMTQSRISRHLGILKLAGFVEEERKGKWVVYKVAEKKSAILSYVQQQIKNEPAYPVDTAKMKETLRKKLCPNK
jgi:ArsR family transcriptional regulator